MIHTIDLVLLPEEAFLPGMLEEIIASELSLPANLAFSIVPLRRSIDARSRQPKVNLRVQVYIDELPGPALSYDKNKLPFVGNRPVVVVVGAGPAGLFAALRLIELGLKPIVIERGKDVRARRRDLAAINKDQTVNPESNYCFGEGGAGTYSDGKLYTRSTKRGDIRRVLEIFVDHGASPDILVDAHPHIGTNKLPQIVSAISASIVAHGGEIHFDTKMLDLHVVDQEIAGIETSQGKIETKAVLLATGHSARDVFELLYRKDIAIEAKPFALGVRIEHPQLLIDQIQYHCQQRNPLLPAASYSLVEQVSYKGESKGVFSFCMCPGGFIVPSATSPGEIVVNGMSPSRRNSRFANSGMVVSVYENDWKAFGFRGPLAGMYYQQKIEQQACQAAGNLQIAPAQRMTDFVAAKASSTLPDCSYQPGLFSTELRGVLPEPITARLQQGMVLFGRKMKGYLTEDAVLVGVESRTSSPVRIPRSKDTLEHPQIKGLFPCGEGGGYAGGIMSAAMDGERVAGKIAERLSPRKFID